MCQVGQDGKELERLSEGAMNCDGGIESLTGCAYSELEAGRDVAGGEDARNGGLKGSINEDAAGVIAFTAEGLAGVVGGFLAQGDEDMVAGDFFAVFENDVV